MDGKLITWIIIVAVLGGIYTFVNLKLSGKSGESEDIKKSSYRYYAKSYIMTQCEGEFFKDAKRSAWLEMVCSAASSFIRITKSQG